MTLEAELIDDRKQIFRRPAAQKEILSDKKLIYTDRFEDIVPSLEQRAENQALIIGQEVSIIPTDKNGNPQYYSSQNFSKRGPLVKLPTFGKKEAIKKQWSDLKARIEASINYADKLELYVGWFWYDPERQEHIVQPWMVLEGRRLEMFALKSKSIKDKIEIVRKYSARDTNLRAILVKVPSRSETKKHDIIMEHVTHFDDPSRFIEWTRFKTRHSCYFKSYDFGFRFQKSATYCPHDIAAHVAYSRRIAEQNGRIIPQPFPLFSEPMLRLYLSLIYDSMKEYIDEKGKTKLRPLTFAEINPILMDAWLRYGNKSTFYNGLQTKGYKSMRNYDWSPNGPGMKFKKD